MRRSALLILAVVAFAQAVSAQGSDKRQLDAKAISDALQDFLTEMRVQLQQDAATWRDRATKVRQEFRDRFNVPATDDAARRRSLLTDSVLDAKLDKLQAGWQLIRDAGSKVWDVMDTKYVKVKDFFQDVLGADYSHFLPHNWLSDGFSWDALGAFDLHSNMADFLDVTDIHDLTKPQSLKDLYENAEAIKENFCTGEDYSPPEKVPTTCEGPRISLTLVPKACIFNTEEKQIECDPAKLILVKTPGFCVLKHYKGASWVGKECKISGVVGHVKEHTMGNKTHTVNLDDIDLHHDLSAFADLFHHGSDRR